MVEKKQIAFVRYYYRMNAEFAREAMMEQPLDDDEILNVRWCAICTAQLRAAQGTRAGAGRGSHGASETRRGQATARAWTHSSLPAGTCASTHAHAFGFLGPSRAWKPSWVGRLKTKVCVGVAAPSPLRR